MKKKYSPEIKWHVISQALANMKPGRLSATGKWFNWIRASALALLFSVAGLFISEASFAPLVAPLGAVARIYNRTTRIIGLAPSALSDLQENSASHTPLFFSEHNEKRPFVPPAIVKFLETYALAKYDKAFFDAIRFVQFGRVAGEIYRHTGYELMRLDIIPDFIRETHEVLSYPLGAEGRISHFLFWQPLFRINKFYYSYKGHDIFLLQKKLATLDLYGQRINGVVDTELLKAVVQFQKQMGLEITGFPDDKTVFLACQLANQSDNSLHDGDATSKSTVR